MDHSNLPPELLDGESHFEPPADRTGAIGFADAAVGRLDNDFELFLRSTKRGAEMEFRLKVKNCVATMYAETHDENGTTVYEPFVAATVTGYSTLDDLLFHFQDTIKSLDQ